MRLGVNKTYKMLIGGAFVRSESNRSLTTQLDGKDVNFPSGTRKDVRDAVKSAQAAQPSWAKKTAYNRSQILYRMAEMLEARAEQMVEVLGSHKKSREDVEHCIDRLVYYAGWCDKYSQLLGTVNPVAAPYFNFSMAEPLGVIGIICPNQSNQLLPLVSLVAPAIAGGNTVVCVSGESSSLATCEFGEVVATSDVPAGVINLLTGRQSDMVGHLSKHMDVQGLSVAEPGFMTTELISDSTENLKRVIRVHVKDWADDRDAQGLSWIEQLQEIKTVWHPMGM